MPKYFKGRHLEKIARFKESRCRKKHSLEEYNNRYYNLEWFNLVKEYLELRSDKDSEMFRKNVKYLIDRDVFVIKIGLGKVELSPLELDFKIKIVKLFKNMNLVIDESWIHLETKKYAV